MASTESTERFVEIEKTGGRNLRLVQCEGIQLGASLITPEMLKEDARNWSGYDFGPAHASDVSPDDLILRRLAYGEMPLEIIGESAVVHLLILRAELVKFPPSKDITGLRWPSYGVRLIPERGRGRVVQIILDRRSELAINHVERSTNSVILDLGNGCLRLEVCYTEQDPETLSPLIPPVFP